MAFCSKCGKQLQDADQFCPDCGAPIGEAAPKRGILPAYRLLFSAVIAFISGFIGNYGYEHRWSGNAKAIMPYAERRAVESSQSLMQTVMVLSFIMGIILLVLGIVLLVHSKKHQIETSKIVGYITKCAPIVSIIFCIIELYIVFFTETCYLG